MKLKCHHCKHSWNYEGKRDYYATCPNCHFNVNLLKNRPNNILKETFGTHKFKRSTDDILKDVR